MRRQPLSAWVNRLERDLNQIDIPRKTEPDEHGGYYDQAEVLDWLRDPAAKLTAGSEYLSAFINRRPEQARRLREEAGNLKRLAGLMRDDPLLTPQELITVLKLLMHAHQLLIDVRRLEERKP